MSLDDANFGGQFVGSAQHRTELLIRRLVFFGNISGLARQLTKDIQTTRFKVPIQFRQSGRPHIGKAKFLIAFPGLFTMHCLVIGVGRLVYFHRFHQRYHTGGIVHGQIIGRANPTHQTHPNFVTQFPYILDMFFQEPID